MRARRLTTSLAIAACLLAAPAIGNAEDAPVVPTIEPLPATSIAEEAALEASPIPEPAGLLLLGAGLSTMVLMRRRLG